MCVLLASPLRILDLTVVIWKREKNLLLSFVALTAALKHAIREGDIAQVRGALAVPGLNPDTIDTVSGMNLLTLAATYGQDEIVKLLLRRGAGVNYTDQNRNGMTALIQAAEQVSVQVKLKLISSSC